MHLPAIAKDLEIVLHQASIAVRFGFGHDADAEDLLARADRIKAALGAGELVCTG